MADGSAYANFEHDVTQRDKFYKKLVHDLSYRKILPPIYLLIATAASFPEDTASEAWSYNSY